MNLTKHIQILRVPGWDLDWGGAGYYGRRWALHIGPFLIFIWQMSEAQYEEWCKTWFGEATE